MKVTPLVLSLLTLWVLAVQAENQVEDFAPPLPPGVELVWAVPAHELPATLWVYQARWPRIFSTEVISNSMVLASLTDKRFPNPSIKDFFIWEDRGPNYPGGTPTIFGIRPRHASIFYCTPHADLDSMENLPDDRTVFTRACETAALLGLNTNQLRLGHLFSNFSGIKGQVGETNSVQAGRGVFLSRVLDGLTFLGFDEQGFEGFCIEYGSQGRIRTFTLTWPNLVRYKKYRTATLDELGDCIRAHQVIVLPEQNETGYFARLKQFARTRKLTIEKATPYYGEGTFGQMPVDDAPPRSVAPFVELEATADFGQSNTTVRILLPVLSNDLRRLLKRARARPRTLAKQMRQRFAFDSLFSQIPALTSWRTVGQTFAAVFHG